MSQKKEGELFNVPFAEAARDFLNSGNLGKMRTILEKKVDENNPLETREYGDLQKAAIQCLERLQDKARYGGYSREVRAIESILKETRKESSDPRVLQELLLQLQDNLKRIAALNAQPAEKWPDPQELAQDFWDYQSQTEG